MLEEFFEQMAGDGYIIVNTAMYKTNMSGGSTKSHLNGIFEHNTHIPVHVGNLPENIK